MAVVALVAGICGLTVVPFIGSIVAVIIGPMARKQIRQTGEGGDGMALGGIITGWVGIVFTVIIGLAVILPLILVAASTTTTYG